jgi:hypothetical protein
MKTEMILVSGRCRFEDRRRLNAIQFWHDKVHQYYVRLKLLGLLNSRRTVAYLSAYLKRRRALDERAN